MSYYGDNVGLVPLQEAAGITKPFNWPSHKGVDLGYKTIVNTPVLAWQDGVVVRKGYGYEVGYYIVMEHTYKTGKRWTGYIHLADVPNATIGRKYQLGQQIGNARRGNTGKSNGPHLHLYLTKIVPLDTKYTWDNMLANSIDPVPYLYYSKKYNTDFISVDWKKELKPMIYPDPVARDEYKHQCRILSTTRRMRKAPDGDIWDELCKPGIYNVKESVNKGAYTWGLIDEINNNQFWVAIMAGEDLPAKLAIVYPEPVDRNPDVEQCDIKSDTRRLRSTPSSADDKNVYERLCKKGIYNVFKYEAVDDQDWALISTDVNGHEFWVAVMDGEDLPIANYKDLYFAEVAKTKKLNDEVLSLGKQVVALEESYAAANTELAKIKSEVNSVKTELAAANQKVTTVTEELAKVKTELATAEKKLQIVRETVA